MITSDSYSILFLSRIYCYIHWNFYKTNVRRGSSESFAKFQAEAALNFINMWMISPIFGFMLKSSVVPLTKYAFMARVILIAAVNFVIVRMLLSKHLNDNYDYFSKFSFNQVKRYDRMLIIVGSIMFICIFIINYYIKNVKILGG